MKTDNKASNRWYSPERLKSNAGIAWSSLTSNKLRSGLTALGVIFGVAAVIAMLAIGSGARQEVLAQMELVGVNNILIEARYELEEEENNDNREESKRFSPGLTLDDVRSIYSNIPGIRLVSPEVHFDVPLMYEGRRTEGRLIGVEESFFNMHNLSLHRGRNFNLFQTEMGLPVCIIGHTLQGRLFGGRNPVGEYIKAGNVWFKVIGVLEPRYISDDVRDDLGIMDYGTDVFAPVQTVLIRYRNRGDITRTLLEGRHNRSMNYHQIDRLTVQAESTDRLEAIATVIRRMLLRRHNEVEDFKITVPELLLRQEQHTRDIFNLVLGSIAGISLLVGGIGIMNIMLASVWERIREIGLRKAVGATERDIIVQFVWEAVLISISGGIAGILLGTGMAAAISYFSGIQTLVTWYSVAIAFWVSAMVGIVFGFMPAKKAAQQDPITSLRNE
jgi:putative ABC transport system permease protein